MSDCWNPLELDSDIFEALNQLDIFPFDDVGFVPDAGPEPSPPHTVLEPCPNCDGNDWDCDEHRGDVLCLCCGYCDPGIMVNVATNSDRERALSEGTFLMEEDVRVVALNLGETRPSHRGGVRKRRRSQYKRTTYLRERISQWFMSEPDIPEDDWETIVGVFAERFPDAYFPIPADLTHSRGVRIKGTARLDKEAIRSLLHACDALTTPSWADPRRPRHFTTRYLEKWLSIRWKLTGQATTSRHAPAILLDLFMDDFARVEQAFRQTIQHTMRRKSFPFYNDVIHKLFALYTFEDLADDFPRLKTRRAQRKSNIYWWHICKYLRWPYLTKEPHILRYVKPKLK